MQMDPNQLAAMEARNAEMAQLEVKYDVAIFYWEHWPFHNKVCK